MKKILLSIFVCLQLFIPVSIIFAGSANDPFGFVPKAKNPYGSAVAELEEKGTSGHFWEKYNKYADDYVKAHDVGAQMGSGIMNWDTIVILLGRLVKFLANGALVVGSAMIIYAGYMYVASVFAGDQTSKANDAIKRAIIGIVIVIFSYAILRWVLHAFL